MKPFFTFEGRGDQNIGDDSIFHLEPEEGTVLLITKRVGQVEFVLGFCREAFVERWGCYCMGAFVRASDPGQNRSWAVSAESELLIYSGVNVYLVAEEEWMRNDH
jgi:hypothetical protein